MKIKIIHPLSFIRGTPTATRSLMPAPAPECRPVLRCSEEGDGARAKGGEEARDEKAVTVQSEPCALIVSCVRLKHRLNP
jgi:hypothetical protein